VKNRLRIVYLDVLRVLAVIAVIFIHTSAQHWGEKEIPYMTWLFLNLWDCCVQWAVPVFIMISGAVFLSKDHSVNIRILYTGNIKRIIIAYLTWSFIYSIYQVWHEGGGFLRVLALTLDGHYHLWFLFMITSLYILTPLLRKLSDEDMKYLIKVAFVLCFAVPTLVRLKDAFLMISENDMLNKVVSQIFSPYMIFMKYIKIDYISYYILGHFLHETTFDKKQMNRIYFLAAVSLIFTVGFSSVITLLGKEPYGIFDIFTLNMLMVSVGVFVFIKQHCSRESSILSDRKVRAIGFLSSCTFGIYLVHAMILEIIKNEFGIDSLSFPAYISVPVIGCFVFLISLGITVIIKKIPVLNRYMV